MTNDPFQFSTTLRLHAPFDGGRRQVDGEGRALAFPWALHHHTAAVKFDQMFDKRKAEPQTSETPRDRGVALFEPVEDVRQQVRADALTGIPHDYLRAGAAAPESDPYPPPVGRELDGVRHQIPDDLLQAVGVAGNLIRHLAVFEAKVRDDDDAFAVGRLAHVVERRHYHRHEFDWPGLQPHLAADDAGRVEQVFDQSQLRFTAALYGLRHPRDLRVVASPRTQQTVPAEDRVERRAQFVRNHG